MTDLERKITEALANKTITSGALDVLIQGTEAAITAADEVAKTERARALDPALSPDPKAARAMWEDAEFNAQRLRTLLRRIQLRYQQVVGQEQYDAWAKTFDAVKPIHAAAAAKLRAVYLEFAPRLVEALAETQAADIEVHGVMAAKPYRLRQTDNDGRALSTVELAARGLTDVAADFSIMKMKMPAFDTPNQLAWPPHQPMFDPALFAPVIIGDRRSFTMNWWEVRQQQQDREAQAQAKREQEQQQAVSPIPSHADWWQRKRA
jgi:hypothetical protein